METLHVACSWNDHTWLDRLDTDGIQNKGLRGFTHPPWATVMPLQRAESQA